jgi:hypothetical protein
MREPDPAAPTQVRNPRGKCPELTVEEEPMRRELSIFLICA